MASLIRLFTLLALAVAVLASPHVSRHVYNHAHRAIGRPDVLLEARNAHAIPRRQRALNKRCIPRPTNSTASALPSSTAPINVAPVPSLATSSTPPSSSPQSTVSTPSYVPPSQAPSPSPTTSSSPSPTIVAPSPTPTTSTPPPPPTPTSTPAPAQTSSSSGDSSQPSYMQGTQQGQGTWFDVGLGACGITNNNGQNIVAVAQSLFDSYPGYNGVNPNQNPVCGRQITATYQGKSVTVTVTDRCTGCALTSLDFSPNAFNTLAAASVGRIDIAWKWS